MTPCHSPAPVAAMFSMKPIEVMFVSLDAVKVESMGK
jgi:hypothetical protein